jgi:hypothetical protein
MDPINEAYARAVYPKVDSYVETNTVTGKPKNVRDGWTKAKDNKWVQYAGETEEQAKLLVYFYKHGGYTFTHFDYNEENKVHITQVYLGNNHSNATRAFKNWERSLSDAQKKKAMRGIKLYKVPRSK